MSLIFCWPKASEVLIHPKFWDSDKRLSFLRDASDRVERKGRGSAILQALQSIAPLVLGTKPSSKRDKKMEIVGPIPEGFDGYFRSWFPKLLMEVYKVLHKYCRGEEAFSKYFKGSEVHEIAKLTVLRPTN
ncbi:inactive serine/threonine-protein kinase/endoribonuclease IRE1-like [Rhododendron vialii]|uniref:inactive serine/threonine-protein kinase/endoribonuclease IRE1-like n=1 Tax=Rhododendron vialii TaxID=182163 RepID=UPI00265EF1DB|nr:inactive serine/threonine-protein kinase/endoribonuclease IRE1-like [Rhododendron vialii]